MSAVIRPRPLLAGVLLLACMLARADEQTLELQVQAVSAELRCLVCQNQTLADSHAELAVDLKNQVREQLRAGRTPEQVVAFMTERYGDFVRYRPPLKASTLLLWLGPGALLLVAALGLWRHLSARQKVAPELDLSPQDQALARTLLQEGRADPVP
jgi:cytochrome c-type biogenesis protein CcmH/NrfF